MMTQETNSSCLKVSRAEGCIVRNLLDKGTTLHFLLRLYTKKLKSIMARIPANIVKRMLFVKSAVTMAAMPANNRTFPKETKNFSDCIKSSGNIKAVITAGGTYRKHPCIHGGISQIPKRKIKDNLVKYVKIPPKSKTSHTFIAIFSSNVQKRIQ